MVFADEPWWSKDQVYVVALTSPTTPEELTPAQARELAAALLRAADEAEAGK
ncbi:hypothetical protein [Streptomyces sp. ITFR-6]|uniref:hypothetical protein n=1 Tax=Streptomyces sp. ITFR-6 TaxID=3075197 RepID=UPI002889F2B6|nr:hypothetical protein [Streptomyces sp. ITFR-6]WNI28598.1 hypothetical protein RLT59_07225 [Streptomyces sp. ITFR-6]